MTKKRRILLHIYLGLLLISILTGCGLGYSPVGSWYTEENGQEFLLNAIEEELAKRLKENPIKGYEVQDVLVQENTSGEIQGILITVSACSGEKAEIQIEKVMINQEKEGKTLAKEEDERLKDYYGTILEIPPEQIEICLK